MKRSTLELLCCPGCQTELTLRDESGNISRNEGELFCSHCERSYIIKNGIVHFIDLQELEGLNQAIKGTSYISLEVDEEAT